jgi:hypothetical protein
MLKTKKPDISVELIRASCRDQRGMQFQGTTDNKSNVLPIELFHKGHYSLASFLNSEIYFSKT